MKLVPPHGGQLKPLLINEEGRLETKKRAQTLPPVYLSSRETSDLIMLAMGAFSPLSGFMGHDDYQQVIKDMHLADGTLWPIPITLAVTEEEAKKLSLNSEIALIDRDSQEIMGIFRLRDKFTYDPRLEARLVFGTEDEAHPGVAKIYAQPKVYLGGEVVALSEGPFPALYGNYFARPEETRRIFQKKGWQTVAAFQTRNPMHRSHEYCTKIALEVSDGLFIHPLVGKLKADDIPAEVRMQCYEVLLAKYYPQERIVIKVYPMEMRYAGPREAVLHAIIRQNFGCSHLIIGRDHAGVGNYYGPFAAQKIFDQIGEDELYIKPLKIDWTFWCYQCDGMASLKTCPHSNEDRVLISGTKLREMLARGERPPKEFSRPEVVQILLDYYQQKKNR
ncbi:MAG TPA: sulfate adenylyltransferase [Candidatus Aminicenantes bacterium]|nr:sulfate adenylyltransferase [Candidatus Aminicenantes bacterium]